MLIQVIAPISSAIVAARPAMPPSGGQSEAA